MSLCDLTTAAAPAATHIASRSYDFVHSIGYEVARSQSVADIPVTILFLRTSDWYTFPFPWAELGSSWVQWTRERAKKALSSQQPVSFRVARDRDPGVRVVRSVSVRLRLGRYRLPGVRRIGYSGLYAFPYDGPVEQ